MLSFPKMTALGLEPGASHLTEWTRNMEKDHLKELFPALNGRIARLRQQDPAFEEICRDLLSLCSIRDSKEQNLTPQAIQNITESIQGLESEILAKVIEE